MDYQTFSKASPSGDIGDQIRRKGSAVVRQAWPPGPLAEIRNAISGFCDRRREEVAAGRFSHATMKMYSTHGVGTVAGLIHDKFLDFRQVRAMFQGSKYEEICRAYYGSDRLYCQLNRCGFREHRTQISGKSFIPYHQDSYSQDERVDDVLNCWMPLDPCGRDAPGLEVVMDPCFPDFPRKDFGLASENAAYDFITIDRDEIVKVFGESFLHPEFEVGDCLIFSQNVIHRTYATEGMSKARINFELRVFAEHCIHTQDRDEMISSVQAAPLFGPPLRVVIASAAA